MLRRFLLLAVLLLPVPTLAQIGPSVPGIVWTQPQTFSDGASHSATMSLVFPSYAAFVAFNPMALGATMVTASTAGYSTPGDGGGSTYDWNAASTATADAATSGASYGSSGIFVVQPTGVTTGRWILRMPGGVIHPEQAGAKCDGVTNDINPLTNLSNAVNASTSLVYNGVIIQLNPNKWCLFATYSWQVPNGATAEGNQQAITQNIAANNYTPWTSGFIHPAGVALQLGTGAKLKNVAVMRQNLPVAPTTFQQVMAAPNGVMKWWSENGNLTNVAVNGGASGAGCQVGDILQVAGGLGDFAWVQVATVTSGVINTVNVLNPGAFINYPASPATARNPVNGLASHCTTLPQITFTAGTPMSVGVLAFNISYMEDVAIVGFNTALYASALTARNVQFDSANGVDITNNGSNGSYFNFTGGELWSSQAASSSGVAQVTGIVSGGTNYATGIAYTVNAGTCTTPAQITPTAVNSTTGAITAAIVTTYGACTAGPGVNGNPATIAAPGGGTSATLNLLWASYDYRPGMAYNVHDNCSGCTFWNLQSHGWNVGLNISDTGFDQFFGLILETAGFSNLPTPPVGISIGVQVQNCVSATIWDTTLNNFSTGLYLHNTEWQHAALPGTSCGGSLTSPTYGGSAVSVFGGTIGSSFGNYKYGVDIGPYSRGQVEGITVFTPGAAGSVPYNVEPNIYGWSIRDALSVGQEAGPWIAVDPTSLPNLTANAVPSGNTVPSPRNIMGGLPTTCPAPGTFTGTLINNSGVINVCP